MTAWRLWAGTGLAVLLCPLHGFAAAAAEADGDPAGQPIARADGTAALVEPGRVRVSTNGPAGGTCVAVDKVHQGWSLGRGVLVYHRPRPAAAGFPSVPAGPEAVWGPPASPGPAAAAQPGPCGAPADDTPAPGPVPAVPAPAPVPVPVPAPGRVTVDVSGPEGAVCVVEGPDAAADVVAVARRDTHTHADTAGDEGACRPGPGPGPQPPAVVVAPPRAVPPRVPDRPAPQPVSPEPRPEGPAPDPEPAPGPVPHSAPAPGLPGLPDVPAPEAQAPEAPAPAASPPPARSAAEPARLLWRPYYRSVALQRRGPDGLSTVMLMVVVTTPAVLAAAALRPRSRSRGA
ncbi:hypothetical protein [Streptomyces sp. NPDC089799]|uniref:hypothetical protein n=1 Tax=Streptomyces sp. NPDC089799 TaxID=3155066 RepID=UPI003418C176